MHGLKASLASPVERWPCRLCGGFTMRSTLSWVSPFRTRRTSLFYRRWPLKRSALVIAGGCAVIDEVCDETYDRMV